MSTEINHPRGPRKPKPIQRAEKLFTAYADTACRIETCHEYTDASSQKSHATKLLSHAKSVTLHRSQVPIVTAESTAILGLPSSRVAEG